MVDYKSQYERYYGNMKKKAPGRVQSRDTGMESLYGRKGNGSQNFGEKLVKKFILQLVGSLMLLVLFLGIKMIPIEGAKEAYVVSKEAVDKNFDINEAVIAVNIPNVENYKETALDYIDEIKSLITGDKTLKDSIKEEYMIPVVGKIKSLEGENTGLVIQTDGEKEIQATFDGTIREVKEEDSGKHVIIDHGKGVETYYGLLSSTDLKEGDVVKKGEVIGKTGIIDSTETKGIVYKFIYMGIEKDPTEFIDFSSLESV
ncbi:peptidoglycan DD-metalloendopeptidase family protein [Clostridium paraputrificum]|uniref:peptidoglycan DD-metalloendopeptidase family protein n=1 Tax=Clostridium TaxID=1485 RepID=UPI003D35639B